MSAAVGALLFALTGLNVLSSSIASLVIATRGYTADSGGIAAVSLGIDVFFLSYALLAMASIVVNRMLAGWARGSGGGVRALHRTQRLAIVLAFAVLIASVVVFNVRIGPLPFLLVPLSGIAWGGEFLLTSALLGAYALRFKTS